MQDWEQEYFSYLERFLKEYPSFEDWRINYRTVPEAMVVNIIVKYWDKILLLKRSQDVWEYKWKWMSIAWYLDEKKSLKDKVFEELKEEVNINIKNITSIKFSKKLLFNDVNIWTQWIVYPVLVEVDNIGSVKIDWESEKFDWVDISKVWEYDIVPFLLDTMNVALGANILLYNT